MPNGLRSMRIRVLLAIMVGSPILAVWALIASYQLDNMFRHYFVRYSGCQVSWRSGPGGCVDFTVHPLTMWLELAVSTIGLAAVCYLLVRWVLNPLRDIAAAVGRFGPNSLGLRLNSTAKRDEVRGLSDAVDAMLDRLGEGYEAQRRFAANASHELRTPLATQRALIEVSLASPLTPDQLELLSRQLLATNERNEKLVDGLLTLAETERGLLAHDLVRLDRIVAVAVETLRPMAKERELELLAELAPVSVNGEPALLDRLATNLVHNAIKYNEAGGWVRVRVTRDATLTVTNTGPSVAPDLMAGLFEPFRRLGGDRLEHGGGVGLGLTIARSIVAAHSGSIDAGPNPGGGLVVQARLTAM